MSEHQTFFCKAPPPLLNKANEDGRKEGRKEKRKEERKEETGIPLRVSLSFHSSLIFVDSLSD